MKLFLIQKAPIKYLKYGFFFQKKVQNGAVKIQHKILNWWSMKNLIFQKIEVSAKIIIKCETAMDKGSILKRPLDV